MELVTLLKKYYGYSEFRPGQRELIDEILLGHDVLGIMPTGGGKSICYQLPALVLEGLTLVISPLISLMKDQVDTLKEYGIAAELINSSLSQREFREVMNKAREGAYKLLYVAPERLETELFLDLVKTLSISMIAVDEAHCVSQWGHDFRPSYKRIGAMIEALQVRPIVAAFTATATPLVKEDIKKILKLRSPYEWKSSFDRPNLYFEVTKPDHKLHHIQSYLETHRQQSGIIYCATRKNVDELYERLNKLNFPATKYHAGLSETERNQNQEDFLFDKIPVMIATNAFGMGIDKPNVRFVIHYNMPKNMESYYQEAGRAGRDGEDSECILLYSTQDIMTNRYLIEVGAHHTREIEYDKLNQMVDYCNTEGCLRNYILKYFGQEVQEETCDNCGNCNNEMEKNDITVEAQKILSCVKRMQERFGSSQVADVLKGANTQKIKALRFNELSTYGIMRDYSKDTIKELISFLIAEGYLELEGTQYPVVRLTEESYLVLKGKVNVYMKRILIKKAAPKVVGAEQLDEVLYEALKDLRMELAQNQSIQPFMVFPDSTLKEMARTYPATEAELLKITGVGEYKFNKYGTRFMSLITHYIASNQERVERLKAEYQTKRIVINSTSLNKVKSAPRDSYKQTYELYKQGLSIPQMADERDLTHMTIENHLIKCAEEGMEIRYEDFIPAEYEGQIYEAIRLCGGSVLKPIKEQLPEEVSYTAIKFAVVKYNLQEG